MTLLPNPLRVAMVAGEPSGDLLAASLLGGLKERLPAATHYSGIGGPRMTAEGFEAHWPMDKLTVRGYVEALRHIPEILGIRNEIKRQLLAEPPSVFIGVDAPDFNFGLEQPLREAGIPTVHFVCPSIWAWRGGRIKKIAKAVNHMLVVFPFEDEIYRKAGIAATYVGHPLAEVIPMAPDVDAARSELGLPADGPVVAILPGSRMSELKYNTAAFVGAAKILSQRDPQIRFIAPMAGAKQTGYFRQLIAEAGLQDVPLQIVDGSSHAAMAAADAVLVASGTATLEVALFKKPMVIAYKMMRASWEILRHMGYLPWVGLPNILAREFLVPELLQDAATPQAMADALWKQLDDAALRDSLKQRFVDMHHALL